LDNCNLKSNVDTLARKMSMVNRHRSIIEIWKSNRSGKFTKPNGATKYNKAYKSESMGGGDYLERLSTCETWTKKKGSFCIIKIFSRLFHLY
jgi:hypothetical protein